MSLEYDRLSYLKKNHAAWRLLQAEHAPLIASFLGKTFIATNIRYFPESELISRLTDELYFLNMGQEKPLFPKSASDYLNDWAQNDKGWLRKFYLNNNDEAYYDMTPATEKALAWLESLNQKAFIGTESKLMTVFQLLKQMIEGTETDAEVRVAELKKKQAEIQTEIEQIQKGDLQIMDDTAIKDRFLQFNQTARELLSDFREVEHNFRKLDSNVREQIATWEGQKGELLKQIFGERDNIAESDQGRSFRAFWLFIMDPDRQEEFSELLEKTFGLEAVQEMKADLRLKRIHYDWLEAGEHTQRTVSKLSTQLRRFLDSQIYLENKRISQMIDHSLKNAVHIKNQFPKGDFIEMDNSSPTLEMPMEKPLFKPGVKMVFDEELFEGENDLSQLDSLFNQFYVDKPELIKKLKRCLNDKKQVTLQEILEKYPVKKGLAEIVTYLSIASEDKKSVFDESVQDIISWEDASGVSKKVKLPRIIFNH